MVVYLKMIMRKTTYLENISKHIQKILAGKKIARALAKMAQSGQYNYGDVCKEVMSGPCHGLHHL